MKARLTLYIFLATITTFIFSSCNQRGCTDSSALNLDVLATVNDGSCYYSNVIFYTSLLGINGVPIARIDVAINGESIGFIPGGFFYPAGPTNCSGPATLSYQFRDGRRVNWNAVITLNNGFQFFTSGTVQPSRFEECIRINVIR